MYVKVSDGNTFDVISERVLLLDVLEDDDDRFFVEQELRANGRAWIGGGAAPLIYLSRCE